MIRILQMIYNLTTQRTGKLNNCDGESKIENGVGHLLPGLHKYNSCLGSTFWKQNLLGSRINMFELKWHFQKIFFGANIPDPALCGGLLSASVNHLFSVYSNALRLMVFCGMRTLNKLTSCLTLILYDRFQFGSKIEFLVTP